ncbi:MAG TPA: hypothetical protein VII33_19880 [Nakamurella sp.]
MVAMTAGDGAQDWAQQGIEHWARHGVEEYAEREAAERAELGESADAPGEPGWAQAGRDGDADHS